MLGVFGQIDGYDPVAAAPVTLRMSSVDDPAVCHLFAQTWWPAMVELPTLSYDLWDGGFGGVIGTPASSLSLTLEPWPDLPRYMLADARIRLWTGEVGAPQALWTQRFDGRINNQPVVAGGIATISFGVDDRWLDQPLLATYAGTTGAEGPAALKGTVKPLALGAPRYATGVLIDPANSVFQLSGYGAIEGVEAALDRLVGYGASAGDHASYAALDAASIAPGKWATCLAAGMARFGAPPVGPVSFLLRGDKAGPNGWARKPGQLIRRIALLAGGAGKIDDAALNALDVARPYNLSLYLGEQTTARALIQSIAASVNAAAGVTWMGKLFAAPVGIGTPSLDLHADGSALPPVADVQQAEMGVPWWRVAMEAERTVTVHGYGDVAFTAPLVDMGAYAAGATYREGNIVQHGGGSWIYINPTPTAGNAPPTPPATSNTWWQAFAQAGADGAPGAPGADGQDGASGFTLVNHANMEIAGNTVTKVSGGSSSWNGSVYSSEAWVGGAFVSFKAGQANAYVAIGLTTDPTSDADYASIDYCWDAASNGTAHIYENGASGGSYGAYTPDTIFSIHYDGANVRYYMDGDLKRTVAVASGLKLYLDSSFYTLGGSATITGFGPAGAAGADGLSIAELTIYRRATSAPATPTGGSYNFGTRVLTPPAGWSTSIPAGNDPLYAANAAPSIQGVTGTVTPTWLGVGLLAQEGAATNIIFRRSASAPATPAPSAGVPAGWYDSTASVPAGPDPIWASFGTRPNAAANWTWQTAKVIEGSDGTDGLTLQLSPLAIVIAANSDGSIKDGELPLAFRLKTTRGATNLSPTSPVSVAFSTGLAGTINNTASSSDRGLGSLTGMTATSGYIDVTVTVDGVAQQPQRINVQRKDDPPPPASAISLSTVALGNNTANTYAASPSGAILTLQADASGQLRAILTASYNAAGGAVPRTWQYAAKAVYRAAGSAGAWSDFGAEVTGLLAFRNTSENNPGALSFSQLRTGLTANANYEVGILWRRVAGDATNPLPTGTLTVRQP